MHRRASVSRFDIAFSACAVCFGFVAQLCSSLSRSTYGFADQPAKRIVFRQNLKRGFCERTPQFVTSRRSLRAAGVAIEQCTRAGDCGVGQAVRNIGQEALRARRRAAEALGKEKNIGGSGT